MARRFLEGERELMREDMGLPAKKRFPFFGRSQRAASAAMGESKETSAEESASAAKEPTPPDPMAIARRVLSRGAHTGLQPGLKDKISEIADIDVEKEFAEKDEPFEMKGGVQDSPTPAAPEGTSDVVTVRNAFTSKEGITYYQPEGDPFQYEYDATDKSFTAKKDGQTVVTVRPGDPAYEEFLKHAKGGRTRYYGGKAAAPKAPGAEAPAAEAPEGATGIPELDQTSDREMDVSPSERGDTAMGPEARPDTSMTDDADALPAGNTLLGPTAGALAARGAGRAAMAGAEEAATRGGRMARAAGLREGLDDAEQLRRMKAAGETRGRISYAQQLMEGKRGSAPSTRAGISKQLIDEVVDDISPDDLSPELRRYYDNFDAKTLRQLDLDAADKYLVARLKQNAGSREAAAAVEFFGEAVDDKAAQSLGTKLRIPSAPTGQQLREGAEGVFRGARTAAARAAANPGQVAKMAGRGALATMSAVPDPTDFIMLAAAAPVLGLQELGAREDFGRQLELIAPRYNAAEREPFTLDQLSNTQKQDVREFVLNSPQPLSAAKELLEMRRFITDEALAEIIAE